MTTIFRFCNIEGTEVTSSTFNLVPINFPTITGSYLAIGDPISYSGSLQSLDVVSTVYKVELNNRDASNWYINVSGSGTSVTASANIVSGSHSTGSICAVTFNLIDHVKSPSAIKSVTIDPVNSNIGFNEYFILEDSTVKTTDSSGILVVNLVPGYYNVSFKGAKKITKFQILVPNDATANAIDCLVTTEAVSNRITVTNQNLVGYTAQAADNRFAPKYQEFPLPDNTVVYTNTVLHDATMSVYVPAESKWLDVVPYLIWNQEPTLIFVTSSYTGSAYSTATIESASFATTASYVASVSTAAFASNASTANNVYYELSTANNEQKLACSVFDGDYPGYNPSMIGTATYNPSLNRITATSFRGEVTGSATTLNTTNEVPSGTPTKGTMLYHTGSDMMYVFNGVSWKSASFS